MGNLRAEDGHAGRLPVLYAPHPMWGGIYLSYLYMNYDTKRVDGRVNRSRRSARRAQKDEEIDGGQLDIYVHLELDPCHCTPGGR